ncbi:MAG: methoxymalonyl-ACP biosynthesis protein FkbH, partial [Streptomyces sp.]|nr:methoxymalonyl-ACP biosynthesis protein FkbH [Streptomyces sp.]
MPLESTGQVAPDAAEQLDALRTLHKEGRLAGEFPRVRGLLSGLGPEQLGTAGRLLARLDPDEVRRAHPAVPVVTVAVTGHGTLAELVPALAAELGRHGVALEARPSAFDSYVFDLAEPGSDLYAGDPDVTLCVLDPRIVLDELPARWGVEDLGGVLAAKLALLERLVATHGATARGPLVLNTLPLPREVTAQLVDHRSRAAAAALWH